MEKADFVHFVNALLWDSDEMGRQYSRPLGFRGLMGRPMPEFLRRHDQGGLARSLYDQFTDSCYSLGCFFGINKLISQLGRVVG